VTSFELSHIYDRKSQIQRNRETESHGSEPEDIRVALIAKKIKAARLFYVPLLGKLNQYNF
jgi:hypothetical protein